MENIKFRAWHINDKEMLGHKDACLIPLFTPSFRYREGETVLMQFTGFQDSKGQDIYEGDIVYIAGFGNGVASMCNANGAEFTDRNGDYRAARHAAAESDIGRILGNIHQNPELLEQKQ